MQTALRVLFPPQCLNCGDLVEEPFGLCACCWRETPFLTGLTCDLCGTELPGGAPGEVAHCDDCMTVPRPWDQGRSVVAYRDMGRKLVLALKHRDRTDLARPASLWMAKAAGAMTLENPLVVPVPLHPWRLLKRRYNQAALLSAGLARLKGWDHVPDLLIRTRATVPNKGMNAEERFANQGGAIALNPRRADSVKGRQVLLVDDVMTSGATLSACADVCRDAGATGIAVQTFARVAKGD